MSLFNQPVDWIGHSSFFAGFTANSKKQLTVLQTSVYLQPLPDVTEDGNLLSNATDENRRVLIIPVPNQKDEESEEESEGFDRHERNQDTRNEKEKEGETSGQNDHIGESAKENGVFMGELHKSTRRLKSPVQLVDICKFYPDFFPDCVDPFNVCQDERKNCYAREIQREKELKVLMEKLTEIRKQVAARDLNTNNKTKPPTSSTTNSDNDNNKKGTTTTPTKRKESVKQDGINSKTIKRSKFEVITTYLSYSSSTLGEEPFPLPVAPLPLKQEVVDSSSDVWLIENFTKLMSLVEGGETSSDEKVENGMDKIKTDRDNNGNKPCKFSLSASAREALTTHYSAGFSFIVCRLSSIRRDEQKKREERRREQAVRLREEALKERERRRKLRDERVAARKKREEEGRAAASMAKAIEGNNSEGGRRTPSDNSSGDSRKWSDPLVDTMFGVPEEKQVLVMLPEPLLPLRLSPPLVDLSFPPPSSPEGQKQAVAAALSTSVLSPSPLQPGGTVLPSGSSIQRNLEKKIDEFCEKEEQGKDKGKEKEKETEEEGEGEEKEKGEDEDEGRDLPPEDEEDFELNDKEADEDDETSMGDEGPNKRTSRFLERVHVMVAYTHPVVGGKLFVPMFRPSGMHMNEKAPSSGYAQFNHTVISANTSGDYAGQSLDDLLKTYYEKQGRQRRRMREEEEMEREREEEEEEEQEEGEEGRDNEDDGGGRGEDLLLGLGKPNIKPDDPAWQHLNNLVQLFQYGKALFPFMLIFIS